MNKRQKKINRIYRQIEFFVDIFIMNIWLALVVAIIALCMGSKPLLIFAGVVAATAILDIIVIRVLSEISIKEIDHLKENYLTIELKDPNFAQFTDFISKGTTYLVDGPIENQRITIIAISNKGTVKSGSFPREVAERIFTIV